MVKFDASGYTFFIAGLHLNIAYYTAKAFYDKVGGRRSPAVACWASDHWVVGSNPLGGQVSSLISPHYPRRLLGPV